MVLPQAPFLLGDRASLGVERHTGPDTVARWKRMLGRRTRKSYPGLCDEPVPALHAHRNSAHGQRATSFIALRIGTSSPLTPPVRPASLSVRSDRSPCVRRTAPRRDGPIEPAGAVRRQFKLRVTGRGLMTPAGVVFSARAADSALMCAAPAFTAALSAAR